MKIAVFYHVYQSIGWQKLFNEQIQLLIAKGLASNVDLIHVGINGFEIPKPILNNINFVLNPEPHTEETPTLLSLRDFCRKHPDAKVLYMHTKGITQPMQSTCDWRKIMEYFCIERWQDSLSKLEEHDAVGCLYMDHCYYGFFPHFSGNFWWANASYINRLDDSFLDGGLRQNREFWIGTGNGSLFSFHTTGLNHYAHEYPRYLYAN